jgi:hypothetical protein
MQRPGPALVFVALSAGLACAGDIPLPVKKPKDATGAAAVEARPKGQPLEQGAGQVQAGQEPAKDTGGLHGSNEPKSAAAAKGAEPAAADDAAGSKSPAGEPGQDQSNDVPKEASKGPTEWSPQEIEVAKARCTAILKGAEAVVMPEAPFRQGDCGAPAPVRLMSIGKSPEVALDPPAVLTCDMVVSLARWVSGDLQQLAKKHLGSSIVKITSMSDYACRNAYGRTTTKLSEHGRANALDIRGFVTAKAESVTVLEGWGPTQRDIMAAKAAAEKAAAEAEKAARDKAAAEKAIIEQATSGKAMSGIIMSGQSSAQSSQHSDAGADVPELPEKRPQGLGTRSTIVEGVPEGLLPQPVAGTAKKGLGLAPQQLGGPKEKGSLLAKNGSGSKDGQPREDGEAPAAKARPKTAALPPPGTLKEPPARISGFLHAAHGGACRIFGTTLGPEANNAHRNHFHVDMAPRRHTNICE